MTNFDITRYDVKRICSSSTLIAGDLAKRSSSSHGNPSDSLDEFSSGASPSASSQPLMAIANGDLQADMVWNASTDEGNQHDKAGNGNDRTGGESSASGAAMDYSQAHYSLQEDGNNGGDNPSIVHPVPMFALLNE